MSDNSRESAASEKLTWDTDAPQAKIGHTRKEGVIEYENDYNWDGWQFAPGEVVAKVPTEDLSEEAICKVGRRIIDAESGIRCYFVTYIDTGREQLEPATFLHRTHRRLGCLQERPLDIEVRPATGPLTDEELAWDFGEEA